MTVTTCSPALDAAPAPTPQTSRVQLALNVDDLDAAVAFYSKLFGTPPAKVRPGYANFAVASPPLKLVLLENPGKGGTINHLGVEVTDSATVHSEIARLTGEGLFTDEEIGTTCCIATPGQGLGHRPRRRAMGGLHRSHRQRHLRRQPKDPRRGGGRQLRTRSLRRNSQRVRRGLGQRGLLLTSALAGAVQASSDRRLRRAFELSLPAGSPATTGKPTAATAQSSRGSR